MITNFVTWVELWNKGKSPLVDSWLFFKNPTSIALILVAYVAFVLYLGPKFMKNRKPYNLKNLIILYNALQVLYNSCFWLRGITEPLVWKYLITFGCAEVTPIQEHEFEMFACALFWYYTVNKILDLLDTVFFVLRKKQSHITFLHVQHHVVTLVIAWTVGKYFTGYELAVVCACNTAVHMIMYFYYMVAALGPAYRKFLWWKKYLTMIQIAQFLTVIGYMVTSLWLSCRFNHGIIWMAICYGCINLGLFLKFYFSTYDSKSLISDKMAVCSSLQFTSNYVENQQDVNGNRKKEM